jgi:hypothetical protein
LAKCQALFDIEVKQNRQPLQFCRSSFDIQNREFLILKIRMPDYSDPTYWCAIRARFNARHPKRHSDYSRKKRFGLTPEAFRALVAQQHNLCAICERPESQKRKGVTKALAVDHDHNTGTVRALLCAACNTALGKADDSVERLERMIAYLQKHARAKAA